ncbi:MAG TPA: 2OG-Fe(II) oxygenase [Myxococcales bacterium]|nr:2OG-Fe(II) oxygenase [Myxococcales bacterium]
MPEWVRIRRPLGDPALEALARGVLDSPLVGRSTLAGSFRGSRGFAITFTLAGRAALEKRYPFLSPFLELALSDRAHRALEPWLRRARARPPERPRNAFYLNVLLVAGGGSIGRHTDATLRGPSGDEAAVPEQVTVLYLTAPERFRGGELRLYRGERRVARVRPVPGMLVHFRGDLQHEVAQMEAEGDALRASLVLEQYHLGPEALGRVPELNVQSKAGFAAYLDDRRRV